MTFVDVVMFCFTEKWWDWERSGFAGRTAALARGLLRHPEVERLLVVDTPVSGFRRLTRGRHERGGTPRPRMRWLREARAGVWVVDQARLLPRERHRPVAFDVNAALHDSALLKRVGTAVRALDMTRPVVWLAGPIVAKYARAFPDSVVVYDAVDEWLAHPGYAAMRDHIEDGYALIRERADVVFAVTPVLAQRFSESTAEVVVLPNAADPPRPALGPDPPALAHVPHPRIGYVGALQERLDVDLVARIAERLPEASLVFVGPVLDERHFAPLEPLRNVLFPGPCRPEDVGRYLAAFDVCILPHVDSALTRNMDAVKLHEYVASGRPVVATDLPGLAQPPDLVRRADGEDEWVAAIRAAISGSWRPDPAAVEAYVARNTWPVRVNEAVERIRSHAGHKGARPPAPSEVG